MSLIAEAVQATFQARDFCIWLVLSAQFLATATSSVAAGLPDWLLQLYSIVSFFNVSPSYVAFEGCGSEYRFQTPLVVFVFVWLLVLAQPILIYANRRRKGAADVVVFSFFMVNALYSVVAHQCVKFLNCSRSADGGSIFTGGVATASVKILPDGTALTEAAFMRYASIPPAYGRNLFAMRTRAFGCRRPVEYWAGAGLGSTCRWGSLQSAP
jgi:hypothetical protein